MAVKTCSALDMLEEVSKCPASAAWEQTNSFSRRGWYAHYNKPVPPFAFTMHRYVSSEKPREFKIRRDNDVQESANISYASHTGEYAGHYSRVPEFRNLTEQEIGLFEHIFTKHLANFYDNLVQDKRYDRKTMVVTSRELAVAALHKCCELVKEKIKEK